MPDLQNSISFQTTRDFVMEAHAGQVDKAGQPYFGHLQRVFESVQYKIAELRLPLEAVACEEILHAALLHDVIEDTRFTAQDLRDRGYSEGVIRRVEALTRREDCTSYQEKIEGIAATGDVGTILIKLADNEDNADPVRVAALPVSAPERLQRYADSMGTLRRALARHAFMPGVPADLVLAALDAAPGNEIRSGKFLSPESSSALVANAFGPFLADPERLPELPGAGSPAPVRTVALEAIVRFPWAGGRHPCLDVLVETDDALVGIESKRYEPFRHKGSPDISAAYSRPVWGDRMRRYEELREGLVRGSSSFMHLDAAQLMKHAFALRTAVQVGSRAGKRAVLLYLFAEPKAWPSGRAIAEDDVTRHRREISAFAEKVEGDEVRFISCSYGELLAGWGMSEDEWLKLHASNTLERYDLARRAIAGSLS